VFEVGKAESEIDLVEGRVHLSPTTVSKILQTEEKIISLDPEGEAMFDLFEADKFTTLGDLVQKICWGTSATGYGKKKISKIEYSRLDFNQKSKYRSIIQTSDIKKLNVAWRGEYIPKNIFSDNQKECFEETKLVVARVTKTIQAAVDTKKHYVGKSTVILTENDDLKYALAVILNSKAINFWFSTKFQSVHMSGGYLRFDIPYLEQIPIPKLSQKQLQALKAIYMKCNGTYDSEKVDPYIYELYGFSKASIKRIEKYAKDLFGDSDDADNEALIAANE
jgi:hypothetical protein